jgi:N6-L-threonylcarbamoyladenine synthase
MTKWQDGFNQPSSNLVISPSNLDAIAVTVGPGLVGSLLIGVETAKALAYAWQKPLIPVNHMLGHIYGAWLTYGSQMEQNWPKLALLVSGGHSELIFMESHQKYFKVGWTVDDAAGEAFDKAAKLLGLPYPGGPALSKLAESGNPLAIAFPQPMPGQTNFNFSFSGLKTALYNYLKQHPQALPADVAASFQHAIITSLVTKTKRAAEYYQAKEIILGGGVAANKELRLQLASALQPIPCKIPDLAYTTDNAAVIAATAQFHFHPQDWRTIQADPSLELPHQSLDAEASFR